MLDFVFLQGLSGLHPTQSRCLRQPASNRETRQSRPELSLSTGLWQPQIDARGVQQALIVHIAQDDQK